MAEEPEITLQQAWELMRRSKFPHITEESITARIADVHYYQFGTLMICILTMTNEFKVVGKSGVVDERNFVRQVGERYAYEDARSQLWSLEAYLLAEFLQRAETPETAEQAAAREMRTFPLPSHMDVDFSEVYGVEKLPVWKSHKMVFGDRIVKATHEKALAVSGAEHKDQDSGVCWILEGGGLVNVSFGLLARAPDDATGGFFVRYEDSYESWSPASAFEGGYARIG